MHTSALAAVRIPSEFLRACRRQGARPTRYALVIRISTQTAFLFEQSRHLGNHADLVGTVSCPKPLNPDYSLRRRYRCSTSKFGIGQVAGSNCTPIGLHQILEKIGGGWPVGAAFRSRQLVGFTWLGVPLAPITTRILWLDGLQPGFNRGGNVDSHQRYIYIHGTGDEPTLGRPASHGCTHLAANDLIPLFDKAPSGTLVWIMR